MAIIQQFPAYPAVSDEALNLTSRTGPAPLMGGVGPGTAIPLTGPAAPGTVTPLMGQTGPSTIAPLMGPAAPGTAIPLMGPAAPAGTALMCPGPAITRPPGSGTRPW
jgi:hypothetical protein